MIAVVERIVLAVFLACMLVACHKKVDQAQVAAQVAKNYYYYLLDGRYDDYVSGTNRPDSIPESYRSQLVDNARMFMRQQDIEHKGIKGVGIHHASFNEKASSANVVLTFAYGDGTSEQVLVPMVYRNGVWLMR